MGCVWWVVDVGCGNLCVVDVDVVFWGDGGGV